MPGTTGGLPRGSDSIYLSDQMLRDILGPIPNLQVGYLYSFGNSVRSGRLTLDYLLPIEFGNSAVFGEAHTEFQDFWKTLTGGANNRVDLSFGGGMRRMLGDDTLVGVNGFYDTSRLGGRWFGSGSIGLEMAALLPGNDAIDLNFNWYGNLFNSNVFANAFRRGPENYDFELGYSHELYSGGPDLRLEARGYRFGAGSGVYGYDAGAELKTRDGVFSLKYETGHDRINSTYHRVGGFVNAGLQLDNLLSGGSPFVKPEPIFKSPRNLWKLLTRKVRRSFTQSTAPITGVVTKEAGKTYDRIEVRFPDEAGTSTTFPSVWGPSEGSSGVPGPGGLRPIPGVSWNDLDPSKRIRISFDWTTSGVTVTVFANPRAQVLDASTTRWQLLMTLGTPAQAGSVDGQVNSSVSSELTQKQWIDDGVDPVSFSNGVLFVTSAPVGSSFDWTLTNIKVIFNE